MAATFSQKRSLRPSVKHFSHCHSLRPFEAKAEDEIICSGCALDVLDSAYGCTKSDCDFCLHKSCFELPRQLQHKFHPQHTLTLVSAPPYYNDRFTCDACGDYGTAFAYHWSICEYDLHVSCANMPETLKRDDHVHPLPLLISSSGDTLTTCDICYCIVPQSCWVYYCSECDYHTHLGCAYAIPEDSQPEEPETSREEPDNEEEETENSLLDTQNRLRLLQFKTEMSLQQAQLISGLGRSLAYLGN